MRCLLVHCAKCEHVNPVTLSNEFPNVHSKLSYLLVTIEHQLLLESLPPMSSIKAWKATIYGIMDRPINSTLNTKFAHQRRFHLLCTLEQNTKLWPNKVR